MFLATELERVPLLLQAVPGGEDEGVAGTVAPLPLQRETVELLRRLWRCRLRLALNTGTNGAPGLQMGRSRSLKYNDTDLAAVTHRALEMLAMGEKHALAVLRAPVAQHARYVLSQDSVLYAAEYCAAHDFMNRLLSERTVLEAVTATGGAVCGSGANWGVLRRYAQLAEVYGAETERALALLKDVPALAQRLHVESTEVCG